MNDHRRVLGIDPGLARVGWGVIDCSSPSVQLVDYGGISTGADQDRSHRLLHIYETLRGVIREHRPGVMAVEEVFQGRNPRSGLLSGEGRGACILAGATCDLPVVEFSASVVKVALTGNGRAAKVQVQAMVVRLLGLREAPTPHDASDALAVALTYFQRGRGKDR